MDYDRAEEEGTEVPYVRSFTVAAEPRMRLAVYIWQRIATK